jgi:hypothetical protein
MRGPLPSYRPEFPSTFLEQAEKLAQQRTATYQVRQRARLVLLLPQQPLVSNIEAAEWVQLPLRSVQRWRCRWAAGDFSLEDELGRGRKAVFSPPGPRAGQGSRLGTGRGNHATAESAVPRRRHDPGPPSPGQTDQSEHGVADAGGGCHQAVAGHVVDLSS